MILIIRTRYAVLYNLYASFVNAHWRYGRLTWFFLQKHFFLLFIFCLLDVFSKNIALILVLSIELLRYCTVWYRMMIQFYDVCKCHVSWSEMVENTMCAWHAYYLAFFYCCEFNLNSVIVLLYDNYSCLVLIPNIIQSQNNHNHTQLSSYFNILLWLYSFGTRK